MKHVALLALYISLGLIAAGLLSGIVGKFLPASLGGGTAATA